jgi:hypothetical protein
MIRFTIPAQFRVYVPKVDNSMSLRFETGEIDGETLMVLHMARNAQGWLLFSETEPMETDIPKQDPDLHSKTPSQRLRGVLYVQLQQKLGRKPRDNEWDEYYKNKMNAIIEKIKETLD